ncbi:TetR-like C-terminal domain-containing protein [Companilactobacillus nantensis]|uniref:TetR family transcriptional regulator n=1 Tax=Companilactobacillus nantensis DSM 16982 TaxID=1423774 RepID=A0A0R1WPJ6_9LACO|nr:TetR-like C-terminal domain-containing protein [Companilactobacillus nantensis]KRM16252.1 TetR family transcriptional regulator [Companilactobacillus nantensis DSM 16982]GEO64302.1 TetR family transcriptional regulator [Companilactobacillus nantensis]
MTTDTKNVLRDSLCAALHHKTIDKITIKDVVSECNLTRQTFYNHFADIYDLVEYSASQVADKVLKTADYENWQAGFYQVMVLIQKNQRLTKNVYLSVYRDVMHKYIYEVIYNYIIEIVESQAKGMHVDQSHKNFIAHFYSLAFISIIFEWVRNDMKEDPKDIVDQISVLVQGDFQKALRKYAQ